ncbi:MAG: hypothetical protein JWQ09_4598 [Segetibacter sp.]|nr:hypothetical protein [Segetibacter sp.]
MAGRKASIKQTASKRTGLTKTAATKGASVNVRVKKASTKKVASKKASDNYLTKRILISAASTGFTQAAARTMSVMGQNVVVRNGWVIRVYADGRTERISKIDRNNNTPLVLD